MRFTLCGNCGKEVMIKDGEYYDHSYPTRDYPQGFRSEHQCNGKVKYESNGIQLHG